MKPTGVKVKIDPSKIEPNRIYTPDESVLDINPFTSGCGHWRSRNVMFASHHQQVSKGKAE